MTSGFFRDTTRLPSWGTLANASQQHSVPDSGTTAAQEGDSVPDTGASPDTDRSPVRSDYAPFILNDDEESPNSGSQGVKEVGKRTKQQDMKQLIHLTKLLEQMAK